MDKKVQNCYTQINTDSIPGGESPPAANPSECRPRDTQLGAFYFSAPSKNRAAWLTRWRSPNSATDSLGHKRTSGPGIQIGAAVERSRDHTRAAGAEGNIDSGVCPPQSSRTMKRREETTDSNKDRSDLI